MDMTDFDKYALSKGISSMKMDYYKKNIGPLNYINPMITEERQLNVAQMDVFSRLMADRIIFLGDAITDDTANIITSQLMYLNSVGDEDIKMFINSPGGSVTDGLAIYDVMNFINPDVATYCMGLSASMGAVILSSGTKGKRFSLPHGEIMIHQPLGGTHGQASDILIEAEQIKKCKEELYKILSENSGKSFQEIWDASDRNNWMTAEEAKEFGLIDEVIRKSRND